MSSLLPLPAAQYGLNCQPRLDTGNAHAIHRTSLGTLGTTMSWQIANWRPTSPRDSEPYEREMAGRGTEGKSVTDGRGKTFASTWLGCRGGQSLLSVITLVCNADLEGRRVSTRQPSGDCPNFVPAHDSRVISHSPYCVLSRWGVVVVGGCAASWGRVCLFFVLQI